jgi:hypothetical protein
MALSKGKWNYPPPAVIKRTVKAAEDLGKVVTQVVVAAGSVTINIAQQPPAEESRPNSFDQVLGQK